MLLMVNKNTFLAYSLFLRINAFFIEKNVHVKIKI